MRLRRTVDRVDGDLRFRPREGELHYLGCRQRKNQKVRGRSNEKSGRQRESLGKTESERASGCRPCRRGRRRWFEGGLEGEREGERERERNEEKERERVV